MLLNKLFSVTPLVIEENIITTEIQLNTTHPIFEGHFPNQPVLPGVCMMQMVKEVLEHHLQKPTRLIKANELKFLQLIVPKQGKLIQLKLTVSFIDDAIKADAQLLDNEITLFKFKGIFKKID